MIAGVARLARWVLALGGGGHARLPHGLGCAQSERPAGGSQTALSATRGIGACVARGLDQRLSGLRTVRDGWELLVGADGIEPPTPWV